MENIMVREDGYVRVTMDKYNKNSVAIHHLEDGLSYLNYAKNETNTGTGNPEEDYKIGKAFILSALSTLLEET